MVLPVWSSLLVKITNIYSIMIFDGYPSGRVLLSALWVSQLLRPSVANADALKTSEEQCTCLLCMI